ncbi:MAG: hypothetical protein CME70_13080 [Halobacteriovorax sp.]|nr:hypothetical protein [Halobacteriovorax sp.]|tara:strand:- start:118253 stop:119581 length:1329 start_codon:yes stop_codon:yes gene_type:complete
MKVFLVILFFMASAQASVLKAPPSFELKNKTVVFVDVKTIASKIKYDLDSSSVSVESVIKFEQFSEGNPAFDLTPDASLVSLQGEKLKLENTSLPNNTSTVRVLNKNLKPGVYELRVINQITKNVRFISEGVKSAFWMSDLSDRRYLEQYLPVNLEYDQYKMDFEVEVLGTSKEHQIRTNGEVTEVAKNKFSVSYPEYFTASSIFFHLMPVGSFNEESFTYKSIDGREIPVTIYSAGSLSRYLSQTKKILPELEADYGPFPHNSVTIYGAGSGGMEYCGATITSLSALGHELIHSYFARGIMPARGNAGWVDEAIASWRDSGYRQYSTRSLSTSRMAGHSVYRRTTDRNAYSKGARFMGFLDSKFSDAGGLRPFLKKFKEDRLFKPFLTKEFQTDLEKHFGEDLTQEFSKYIYGSGKILSREEHGHNPFHPKLTEKELFDLL